MTAEDYLQSGRWSEIPGATGLENLAALLAFGRYQERLGVSGDVGEIGVYMGRYLTLLHLLSRPSERVLAIDVFEDFDNFDATGGGSTTEAVLNYLSLNVSKSDMDRLRLIPGDSLHLRPDDIRAHMASSGLRLFSIDGAHSWFHTAGDLRLADELIAPGGVVVLDDILNGGWPGVMDGMARYLLLSPTRRLSPFMIANNKLWLTTFDHHARFIDFAMSDEIKLAPHQQKRISEFFGKPIVGF